MVGSDQPPAADRDDEYLRHLLDALHQASRDYDQAIITVAGGTLALSATFAGAIAGDPTAGSREHLVRAWVMLVASIVLIVASFLMSRETIRYMISQVTRGEGPKAGWRGTATTVLNLGAGIALVLGLSLLAYYAVLNINGG